MPTVCFYDCPICHQQTAFTDPGDAWCEYCAFGAPRKPRRREIATLAHQIMKPRRAAKSQRRRRKNRRPE